nr:hypothetical protein [Tanacetum cinerariifolium]
RKQGPVILLYLNGRLRILLVSSHGGRILFSIFSSVGNS